MEVASPCLFLFGFVALLVLANAQTPAAPGPAPPGPLNLTAILVKGGQYTTLLRLLKETQVGTQIQSQLNNSFNGLTVFAPTDGAFMALKPGTLNSLSPQDQVNLVLYHVLPRYYSTSTFETASNPIRTQASDKAGPYVMNITSTSNQVNVSTGVVETQLNNVLYSDFPLAVYSVDKVLQPEELFGAKPPAEAPAPSKEPKVPAKTPKTPATAAADSPGAAAESSPSAAGELMVNYWKIVWAAAVASVLTGSLL